MNKIIALFILIIIVSCASEKPITGGLKDATPPTIKSFYPENKKTNFNSSVIKIEFDERIALNLFDEALIISPKTDVKIKPIVKKNILTLQIEGAFESNKTYTINIQEGIKDITENNKIENIKYVFSTGNYIDSLTISGTSKIEETNVAEENAKLFLYNYSDSIDIRKHKPLYYTKTKKDGSFLLENLPKGEFSMFYLNDNDNSLTFNDENEKVGFLNQKITLDTNNIILDKIKVFNNDTIIKKYDIKHYCNYTEITFDEQIKNLILTDSNNIELNFPITKLLSNKKYVWFNNTKEDSISIILTYEDYNKNKKTTKETIKRLKHDSLCIQNTDIQLINKLVNAKDSLILEIKEPFKNINKENILIMIDTIEYGNLNKINHKIIDNILTIYVESEAVSNIRIKLDSNSIETYQRNFTNRRNELFVPIADETKTGIIRGKLNYPKDNFILELLDQNLTIVKSIKTKQFVFDKLDPQEYTIRVRIDENNDGIYEQGSYERKTIPEKIVFHNEKINVRANWEIEGIEITIYE